MKSESLFSDRKRSSLPTRAVYSSRQKERPAGSASLRMVDSAVDDDNEEHNEEEDGDLTARIESGADADASSKDSEDGRQKNEDVFLNIAQSTSARRRSMQTERQRVSTSLPPRTLFQSLNETTDDSASLNSGSPVCHRELKPARKRPPRIEILSHTTLATLLPLADAH